MLKSSYRRERGVEEAAWQGEGTATDVRPGLRLEPLECSAVEGIPAPDNP